MEMNSQKQISQLNQEISIYKTNCQMLDKQVNDLLFRENLLKEEIKKRWAKRSHKVTIVEKDIGYELRSCPPIPFDCEYTRDLGYGAIRFLLGGGTGALITLRGGNLEPIPFNKIIDPQTGKIRVRMVNTNTESYQVALKYMIRLEREDLEDPETLRGLAEIASLSTEQFRQRFSYLVY